MVLKHSVPNFPWNLPGIVWQNSFSIDAYHYKCFHHAAAAQRVSANAMVVGSIPTICNPTINK